MLSNMNLIYEIFPSTYTQEKNKFNAIINDLDRIKNIGFNLIYLTPIFKSQFIDSGYDIDDYYEINPDFGSLADFKELLYQAHNRDIKIVLDVALNHTSNNHVWFKNQLQYKDYYIIKDEPNNWISSKTAFSTWTKNEDGGYYFHIYSPEQPDLNWDNPKVRDEMKNVLSYWVKMGVDGFRLDVINKLSKGDDFSDTSLEFADKLFENNDLTFSYIKELLHGFDDTLFLGQVGGANEEQIKLYQNTGLDLCLTFNQIDYCRKDLFRVSDYSLSDLLFELNNIQKRKQPIVFLENHDSPRAPSIINKIIGDEALSIKLVAVINIITNGDIIIYQGQESGALNIQLTDVSQFQDVRSHNFFNQRLNQNDDPNDILDDFSLVSREHARRNINIQTDINDLYCFLIKLNKEYNLSNSEYISCEFEKGIYKYGFKTSKHIIQVIVNCDSTAKDIEFDEVLYYSSLNHEKNKIMPYEVCINKYEKG